MPAFYDIGDLVRLRLTFTDIASVATDPTAVTIIVTSPSGIVTTYLDAVNDPAAVGAFYKDILPNEAGVWRYRGTGTGAVVAAGDSVFYVTGYGLPCQPWVDEQTVRDCCTGVAATQDLAYPILVASDVLWRMSGRQFGGLCTQTVRPCSSYSDNGVYLGNYVGLGGWSEWGWPMWYAGGCTCNRPRECGCSRVSEIQLGASPIAYVSQVLVDGAVLPATRYRVDDRRWLVRLNDADGTNPGWQCCQDMNLPTTAVDTFAVTFTAGEPPPPSGVMAATELACQIGLACAGASQCRLPQRLQSLTRQGVSASFFDPQDFLTENRTGLYLVDLFLQAVNPHRLQRRAAVVSPDTR
jgi:hypothetical protein